LFLLTFIFSGEGDRLSGLIVDVFGPVVVAQSGALWVEKYQARIEAALRSVLGTAASTFIWRQQEARLNQDGYFISNSTNKASINQVNNNNNKISSTPTESEEEEEGEEVAGSSKHNEVESEPLVVVEHGVRYWVRPDDGQKTGFYCDQRDNRRVIRELSAGRTVLDTYCYSGGFSINAALGGATSVVAVDSSQAAIDTAVKNAEFNQVGNKIEFVKSDAMDLMRKLQSEGKLFDIVICDPPKLAPSRASLERAKNK
jgi:23S rRNA G2069 N7-methylase RlmK/C1962 C5-methylase RlmI